MQVQSLGWEDPLEEEMATPSSILVWEIPLTEEPGGYSPWGCSESDVTEQLSTHTARLEPRQKRYEVNLCRIEEDFQGGKQKHNRSFGVGLMVQNCR